MHTSTRCLLVLVTLAIVVITPNIRAGWVADGVAVCTATGTQDTPTVVPDGAGGAIIAWRDNRTVNTDIYGQRVDPSGNLLWIASSMPVCAANNAQSLPLAVSDGAGGAIVAWQDFRSNNVLDLYAVRIDSNGYATWTANGVVICAGKTGVVLGAVVPDGSGGAIITWSDTRNAVNDIFAQKINASGTVQWAVNGATVCSATGQQTTPVAVSDGAGGAIFAWVDNRVGTTDIYAQRLNAAGAAQWAANGVAVCDAVQAQNGPQIISDGSGGAIVSWADRRNSVDFDMYAQRLDASGAPLWAANGAVVSQTGGNQMNGRLVPSFSGGALVAWIDYRGAAADVYAQRLDASGAPVWTANGVAVCAAANAQTNVQLVSDGKNGAIAAWDDARAGASDHNIYAQRIDRLGAVRWTADGIVVCAAANNQTGPAIAPDGVGGAYVAWADARSAGDTDLYAQRIDAAGHTVVATLLRSFEASPVGAGVEIDWTLSQADPGIEFVVLRADGPGGAFHELDSQRVTRSGLSFCYVDGSCEGGGVYRYRVDLLNAGARSVLFETGPVQASRARAALYQNVPNPFNPSTTIGYFVPERCELTIAVYDARGSLVRALFVGERSKGSYTASWDGRDTGGRPASSGVYYCRLRAGKETLTRTMILLR
jgi:hypothetical protein